MARKPKKRVFSAQMPGTATSRGAKTGQWGEDGQTAPMTLRKAIWGALIEEAHGAETPLSSSVSCGTEFPTKFSAMDAQGGSGILELPETTCRAVSSEGSK